MHKTIRYAVVGIIALLCGGAFADGVPLFTTGPAIKAADPVRQSMETKLPDFVKLHPIVLNRAAFGSNVLTLVIDGKEHRFIGAPVPRTTVTPKKQAAAPKSSASGALPAPVETEQADIQSWLGSERVGLDTSRLSLTRDVKTGRVDGTIELHPGRFFSIRDTVLIERDPNRTPAVKTIDPATTVPWPPGINGWEQGASAPKGKP